MASRLDLHEFLLNIVPNAYFRAPESNRMIYPAIKYDFSKINTRYANDSLYNQRNAYELILIDRDPDSAYVDKLLVLPLCSFDRSYTADGLNHWVFTLYY